MSADNERGSGDDRRQSAIVVRTWLRSLRVPEHRHSIWYYFGGLTLFLLLVMVASGMLLVVYYEPSGAPAVALDGTPLAAAQVQRSIAIGDRWYEASEVIALPLNTATGKVIAPTGLDSAVLTLHDRITGQPIRPSAAWVSVEGRIRHDVEFGPLVRSVHAYSANLLLAAVAIHMFSAFFMRAYRRRRRYMWVTGVVLFVLLLGFGFTGYLLPWNNLAYFATRIGVSLPETTVPIAGTLAATILRGGSDVTSATLTRMYGLHVVFLPLAVLVFTVIHLFLLHLHGLSNPQRPKRRGGLIVAGALGLVALGTLVAGLIVEDGFDVLSPLILLPLTVLPVVGATLLSALAGLLAPRPEQSGAQGMAVQEAAQSSDASPEKPPGASDGSTGEEGIRWLSFYSNVLYRNLLAWVLALGIIITLAVVAPWEHHGSEAMPVDLTKPLITPEGIHPEWYFLWAYQLLNIMPGTASVAIVTLIGIIWLAVPWLDRRRKRPRSPAFVALGLAIIASLVALTVWAYAVLAG